MDSPTNLYRSPAKILVDFQPVVNEKFVARMNELDQYRRDNKVLSCSNSFSSPSAKQNEQSFATAVSVDSKSGTAVDETFLHACKFGRHSPDSLSESMSLAPSTTNRVPVGASITSKSWDELSGDADYDEDDLTMNWSDPEEQIDSPKSQRLESDRGSREAKNRGKGIRYGRHTPDSETELRHCAISHSNRRRTAAAAAANAGCKRGYVELMLYNLTGMPSELIQRHPEVYIVISNRHKDTFRTDTVKGDAFEFNEKCRLKILDDLYFELRWDKGTNGEHDEVIAVASRVDVSAVFVEKESRFSIPLLAPGIHGRASYRGELNFSVHRLVTFRQDAEGNIHTKLNSGSGGGGSSVASVKAKKKSKACSLL